MIDSNLLIIIFICIIVFLICREIYCWYWKINKRINIMEENNRLLKELIKIERENIRSTESIIKADQQISKKDNYEESYKERIDTLEMSDDRYDEELERKYSRAVNLLNAPKINQETYTRIIEIFESLGNYKDSASLLQISINRAEAKYRKKHIFHLK